MPSVSPQNYIHTIFCMLSFWHIPTPTHSVSWLYYGIKEDRLSFECLRHKQRYSLYLCETMCGRCQCEARCGNGGIRRERGIDSRATRTRSLSTLWDNSKWKFLTEANRCRHRRCHTSHIMQNGKNRMVLMLEHDTELCVRAVCLHRQRYLSISLPFHFPWLSVCQSHLGWALSFRQFRGASKTNGIRYEAIKAYAALFQPLSSVKREFVKFMLFNWKSHDAFIFFGVWFNRAR